MNLPCRYVATIIKSCIDMVMKEVGGQI